MPPLIDLIAMAGLGFFGTGHCIGMCGPIVLAVPAQRGGALYQLLYHVGRVTTYCVIGGIAGAVGRGLEVVDDATSNTLSSVAAVQTILSVVAAAMLAVFAVVRVGLVPEPRWMSGPSPTALPGYDSVSKRASRGGRVSLFVWGMMLGTLPCGLSYAAFARALPSGGHIQGAVMVLAFGIGTIPGLLFVGTTGARLLARHRRLSDLVSGAIMAGMALLLLARAAGTVL